MLVNKNTLDAVFQNLKTTFHRAFEKTETQWQKVAMLVTSTSSQNDYKWLSNFPQMRKWIGEKVIKSLEAFSYTIVNDDWEATIEVDRNDIKDDTLGMYGPQAEMAGFSAKRLPDEIVFDLMTNGFTNDCYDGQFFYDTDHPVGDGTDSNKLTVALSAATLAAAQASIGAALTALQEMKDDEGRPLNVGQGGLVLVVPPALRETANVLRNNERLEDGKQNPYKGMFEVLVSARLATATEWHLLDMSFPVKPFIYQEREKPTFVQQTDMNSDNVFLRKKFRYGAEARAAGGYGFWQMAVGSTGTG